MCSSFLAVLARGERTQGVADVDLGVLLLIERPEDGVSSPGGSECGLVE